MRLKTIESQKNLYFYSTVTSSLSWALPLRVYHIDCNLCSVVLTTMYLGVGRRLTLVWKELPYEKGRRDGQLDYVEETLFQFRSCFWPIIQREPTS